MCIKYSVIVPCYNSYQYIDRCIASLEKQLYKKFEVIFIDDCSTDDTYAKLCKKMNTVNFKMCVYQNAENNGPNVARETGVKYAVGEYVCFCDSDDWLDNNYFNKLGSIVEKEKSDCVIYDYNQCFNNGTILANNYTKGMQYSCMEDIIALAKDSLCLLTIKRSIICGIPFPKLYYGEDAALVPIILSRCQKISIYEENLYNYFMRANSASNSYKEIVFDSMLLSYSIVYNELYWKYPFACEYIGVKNILYSAVLVGIKSGVSKKKIKNAINEYIEKYSNPTNSRYFSDLSLYKKVFIMCAAKKIFWPLKLYAICHTKYLKK